MTYAHILNEFPPSSQNNAREIVRGYLEKFENSPSDRMERKLDELGVPGDHDDYRDHDEPTRHYEGYEFTDVESTEEYHNITTY